MSPISVWVCPLPLCPCTSAFILHLSLHAYALDRTSWSFSFLCWRCHHESGCDKLGIDNIAEATALLQSTRHTLEELRKEVSLQENMFQEYLKWLKSILNNACFVPYLLSLLNSLTPQSFSLVWVPAVGTVRPCSLAVTLRFESGCIRHGSAYDCLQSGLQYRLQGLLPESTSCP